MITINYNNLIRHSYSLYAALQIATTAVCRGKRLILIDSHHD